MLQTLKKRINNRLQGGTPPTAVPTMPAPRRPSCKGVAASRRPAFAPTAGTQWQGMPARTRKCLTANGFAKGRVSHCKTRPFTR